MQPASDTPPDDRPVQAPPRPSRRLGLVVVAIAVVVVAADQLAKYWAVSTLSGREPMAGRRQGSRSILPGARADASTDCQSSAVGPASFPVSSRRANSTASRCG